MEPQAPRPGVDLLICSLRFGEDSRRAAIRAASATRKATLRITGYSGLARDRTPEQVTHMYRGVAATLVGCDITIIGGGTRMVYRDDPSRYVHGITEVVPIIGASSPLAKTIGVIPRQSRLLLRERFGLVVADKPTNPYVTIVHPHLDACLLLQYSADQGFTNWDSEWQLSLDYMEALRHDAGHRTAHLVYGGGKATERELLHVADLIHNPANPWWVILVADSGGVAEKYARDVEFRRKYAHSLIVCTADELPGVLTDLGFIGPT